MKLFLNYHWDRNYIMLGGDLTIDLDCKDFYVSIRLGIFNLSFGLEAKDEITF